MKIVIAGATGLVGKIVFEKLINLNLNSVTAITRNKIKIDHPHENLVIDWDLWHPVNLNADVFICCLGTTIKAAGSQENLKKVDFDYIKKFAEAAKLSNAKKFIVISANGADSNSSIFYNKIKGETEEMLQSFQFESLAILRPSLLIGERTEKRSMEKIAQIIMPKFDFLLQGSLKKFQSIDARRVANAIIYLSLNPWKGTFIFESDKLNVESFLFNKSSN